jgi:hypothetical protein
MIGLRAQTDILRVNIGTAADIRMIRSAVIADSAGPPALRALPDLGPMAAQVGTGNVTVVDTTGGTSGDTWALKGFSAYNAHATQSTPFRVEVFDGANTAILWNGTLLAGEMVKQNDIDDFVLYDANGNVKAAQFPAASQTDMEAATSNAVSVTPANFQWHPGACKFWIKATPGGTINKSYNVTSEADATAGVCDITIGTDFSSADYALGGFSFRANTNTTVTDAKITSGRSGTMAAGTVSIETYDETATNFAIEDPAFWCAWAFGDQ